MSFAKGAHRATMDTDWMSQGKCKDLAPKLFFPHDGEGVKVAQRICSTCPVKLPRAMCLGCQARQAQLLQRAVPASAGRRGPQKAICAVAASIRTAIYHMVKSGASHRDLGADYFDRRRTPKPSVW